MGGELKGDDAQKAVFHAVTAVYLRPEDADPEAVLMTALADGKPLFSVGIWNM